MSNQCTLAQCGNKELFSITIFTQKLKNFRENGVKVKLGSIYLIKPLYGVANSNFSRNFAQSFTTYASRRGYNLTLSIGRPANHCKPWEILADQVSVRDISNNVQVSKKVSFLWIQLQGDPNRNFLFQMSITLKLSISDPMLVKPNWIWETVVFWNNVNKQLKNVNKFSKI